MFDDTENNQNKLSHGKWQPFALYDSAMHEIISKTHNPSYIINLRYLVTLLYGM